MSSMSATTRCAKIHKRFRKRCSKDHKCRVLRLDTIYCSIKRLKKKKPPACLLTPFHRSYPPDGGGNGGGHTHNTKILSACHFFRTLNEIRNIYDRLNGPKMARVLTIVIIWEGAILGLNGQNDMATAIMNNHLKITILKN